MCWASSKVGARGRRNAKQLHKLWALKEEVRAHSSLWLASFTAVFKPTITSPTFIFSIHPLSSYLHPTSVTHPNIFLPWSFTYTPHPSWLAPPELLHPIWGSDAMPADGSFCILLKRTHSLRVHVCVRERRGWAGQTDWHGHPSRGSMQCAYRCHRDFTRACPHQLSVVDNWHIAIPTPLPTLPTASAAAT